MENAEEYTKMYPLDFTTSDTFRIYDFDGFGLGSLTFSTGHPFYFRSIQA